MSDQLPEFASHPVSLEYASPYLARPGSFRWFFIAGVIIFIALVALLIPAFRTYRTPATRTQCGSHEFQLMGAIVMYANRTQGNLPPTLQTVSTQILTSPQQSKLFHCPAGSGAYVYLGAGLNLDSISRDTILIYERPSNHTDTRTGNTGMNIAYADGRVQFIFSPQAEKIIAELQAGHNPPRAEKVK